MVKPIFHVNIDTKDFEQRLQEHLDEKCKEIAIQIKKDAKTGTYLSARKFKDLSTRLRKSIKIKKSKYDDGGYIVKAGGRGAMQAWLIEHGHAGVTPAHKRIPPYPYLGPALRRNIKFAEGVLKEKMKTGR